MDTTERFQIFKETRLNNQINKKTLSDPTQYSKQQCGKTPVERTLPADAQLSISSQHNREQVFYSLITVLYRNLDKSCLQSGLFCAILSVVILRPILQYSFTKLHGVTSQRTGILIRYNNVFFLVNIINYLYHFPATALRG